MTWVLARSEQELPENPETNSALACAGIKRPGLDDTDILPATRSLRIAGLPTPEKLLYHN